MRDFDGDLLTKPQKTNVERLIKDDLHANLDIRPLTEEGTIGGMTVFSGGELPVYDPEAGQYRRIRVGPRTILIEQRLAEAVENGQYRFMLAHKAAHMACHEGVRLPTGGGALLCRVSVEPCKPFDGKNRSAESRIEWQADYLASAFLMPAKAMYAAVDQYLAERGLPQDAGGWRQMMNRRETCLTLERCLSAQFGAPMQAVSMRLSALWRHYPLQGRIEEAW